MTRLIIQDQGIAYLQTGVMVGSMTVQALAMTSICLMVFLPTPVIIDPVTGIRSHLVRWSEWTPLAFLMTFMTESIDLPPDGSGNRIAWLHGAAIALSTGCGAIMAMCQTWTQWLVVFTISWVLFCSLFIRLYKKSKKLQAISQGSTVDEQESYERAYYSTKIIVVCTIAWTLLAASFSAVCLLAPQFKGTDSIFASEALVLIVESIFEAISKIWYFSLLVEVHTRIFDPAARTVRRLEELRNFMGGVWDTSTDVIAMCTYRNGRINAVISPSFFGIAEGHAQPRRVPSPQPHSTRGTDSMDSTMVIEVNPSDGSYRMFSLDLRAPVTRREALEIMAVTRHKSDTCSKSSSTLDKNIEIMADLIWKSCREDIDRSSLTMTDLYTINSKSKEIQLRYEAKLTNIEPTGVLIVLRDISERFQRFEAEKKLIGEITARQKDAEANRFTRHEVKNGILAAIGLLDSLKDSSAFRSDSSRGRSRSPATGEDNSSYGTGGYDESLGELDTTLRDILDTIMDHTMSREVIYEEYEVRRERIMVPEVLSAIQKNTQSRETRFTTEMKPDPFPVLGLDPRLLRYIYLNAVSNACRYGKQDGEVVTSIHYDKRKKLFSLQVTNEPGMLHEYLVEMDQEKVREMIFSPGTRLHKSIHEDDAVTISGSSGDGAWIMQKCAKTLKGNCDIHFEKEKTLFRFDCPAKAYVSVDTNSGVVIEYELDQLPAGTWGIVIDDSGIQRKLMDRFLKVAGVEENRRVIVGKDSNEIYGFCNMVVDLIRKHKRDKFLVIADENLEVLQGASVSGMVSGSLCVKQILETLEPTEERRLLALVRSANDSSKDIEKYMSRAHGYLVKAPIDKKGVLGAIKPWWVKRFPTPGPTLRSHGKTEQTPSHGKTEQTPSSDSIASEDISEIYDPHHDITSTLDVIDALCKATDKRSLKKRWRSIQDRLQTLKGDLKTVISPSHSGEVDAVVVKIDTLRLGSFPENFIAEWATLRCEIGALLEARRASSSR